MEDEMQVTIESYKNILESYNDSSDTNKLKKELMSLQSSMEEVQNQRQQALTEKMLVQDEQSSLLFKLQE